jgi:hypothetical protein
MRPGLNIHDIAPELGRSPPRSSKQCGQVMQIEVPVLHILEDVRVFPILEQFVELSVKITGSADSDFNNLFFLAPGYLYNKLGLFSFASLVQEDLKALRRGQAQ